MSSALCVRGLVKTFSEFALGPLDLELETGSVVALVGPNGAGKTTAIQVITGLLRADGGTVEIDGVSTFDATDPAWKENVGYIGEDHAFFENWTGAQNLRFLSTFFPGWSDARARELANRFGLRLNQQARTLSRGDRAKLSIVSTLARSPRILILDEPTAGLDPVVRADFLEALWEMQDDEERTILYSTHILSDVSRLAGELAFLDRGKLLLVARVDDLQETWAHVYFRLPDEPSEIAASCDRRREGDQHRLVSSDREATLDHLRELGADDIRCFHLGIDEIATAVLRRARPRGELVT